jgi:hypothetical protein
MPARLALLPALCALFALVAPLARADVPPPGGETCTLAHQSGSTGCEECGANFNAPDTCASLAQKGLEQRCRTSGGTVWTEIWCRPGGGASTPAPTESKGCATHPASLLAVLALVAPVRRRRG